jgi:hypothetical protein
MGASAWGNGGGVGVPRAGEAGWPATMLREHTARVAKLADAADLGSDRESEESAGAEKTSPIGDPRRPLNGWPGQWRGNPSSAERAAELEAAIANMTRLLARAEDPDAAAELVTERKEMRRELETLQREAAGNVVDIVGRTRGR